ncbi:MAG: hypothetical protein ABI885_29895 [Gammaproteobacteria bacterium]
MADDGSVAAEPISGRVAARMGSLSRMIVKRRNPGGLYRVMQLRAGIGLFSLLFALLPACIDDDTAPEVSDTEQAVSSVTQTSLFVCNNGAGPGHKACDFDLGVPRDGHHVCMVDGIQGPISASGFAGGGGAVIGDVLPSFHLQIDTGSGTNRTISASALCFAADPVKKDFWAAGSPTKTIANAADSANMMCFLSGLRVVYNGFNTQNDSVIVKKNELGQWQIGGSQVNGTQLSAYAQCVKPVGGAVWWYTYGWGGTAFFSLAPNPAPGGVVCGLNRFAGAFKFPNDKVGVSYSALFKEWRMGFDGSSIHGGDSYCMN